MKIAYYVSGHGFGHATRVCEVVRHLVDQAVQVTIVSAAPQFIFDDVIVLGVAYRHAVIDAGGVAQSGPLHVDIDSTLAQVQTFLQKQRNETIERETKWLADWKPDLIATDVAFAPIIAAKQAQIPAAVVSNFTWDYIYSEYAPKEVVETISQDYLLADYLLRLPGYVEVPTFKNRPERVLEIPLVVRVPRTPRDKIREKIGLSLDSKAVLIQFGGHAMLTSWHDVDLPAGWKGILISEDANLPSNFVRVGKEFFVPDLVEASDVVLGKLGYGTCSEVLACSRPLVYVSRPNFNEQEGMLALMVENGCVVELPEEDFKNGKWREAITQAASGVGSAPKLKLTVDGGEKAAEHLIRICKGK